MATITIELTYLDGESNEILNKLEASAGRPRDPDTQNPTQTNKEYLGSFLQNALDHHIRKGGKILHRQAYDATIDPPNDVTVTVL